MKSLLTMILALVLLASITASTGCGASPTATPTVAPSPTATPLPEPTATPAYEPVTIIDSNGKAVTFQEPPRRIVSYSPAFTEVLFALGVGNRLVGRDDFSDFPAEAAEVASIGDAFNVNLELLAGLEPDLVYLTFDTPIPAIEGIGLQVLYLYTPDDLGAVLEQVQTIGRIVDASERVDALVASMKARIEAVTEKLAGLEQGPRVFYEIDPLLYTVGPGSFVGSLLDTLKVQNIAQGTDDPFPQLNAETIIERDPEVILFSDTFSETVQSITGRPGWDTISAVQENRVFPVNADLTDRPGPRIVEGLEVLAKLLYPERFP